MNVKQRGKKIDIFIVMIALLTVTVAISGVSFARYTTTAGTGDPDNARVAKWGFVIDVDADGMFADGSGTANVTPDPNGLSVASEYTELFPNTEGTLLFSVCGNAAVAARISFVIPEDLEIICLKNAEGEVVYDPILWTLTKNGEEVVTRGDLAAIRAALPELTVSANQDVNDSYELKWEWIFERGDTEQDKAGNNEYDTILAKYKADPVANPLPGGYTAILSFPFRMTIDVSQIQPSE